MDAGTIVLGLVLIVAFVVWQRGRSIRLAENAKQAPPDQTQSRSTTRFESVPQSPDEIEVARAKAAAASIKKRFKEELDADHEASKSTQQKLERAERFMKESGLADALPKLWELVDCWPHWVKLPDRWQVPAGVSNIQGEGSSGAGWCAYRWHDHDYRIEMIERPNYFPDDYGKRGEIVLSVDGAEVVRISAYRPLGDSYTPDWQYSSVESLNMGPWLADVVSFQGEMLLERERSTRASFAKHREERAARLNFE